MKSGTYRLYFKLPIIDIGIKIARVNIKNCNPLLGFLVGVIMNVLERKRYKRFVLGKPNKHYQFKPYKYNLCPTYFSCGLFNIVRHAENLSNNELFDGLEVSPFAEDKLDSYGLIGNNLVEVDYGDFTIYQYRPSTVTELDYR